MERGLREIGSIGQVLIALSRQLVWAMVNAVWRQRHVMGLYKNTPIAETADQSCELNVSSELIGQRPFHIPFSASTVFHQRKKQTE